ncbi:MAG: endonuclease/exonuclease/phosphatase family protein [Ruminococcaceae bacterium]|nr:endonuclease/exonuclease/phosphatase family protein [Oscillospiraceae bacterium]
MKKSKVILIALAAVIAVGAVAAAGVALSKKADLIDFGEIVLDGVPEKDAGATRVMSFNLRCKDDPEGSIDNRSQIALEVINQYAPDSFGIQEATPKWLRILDEKVGDRYARIGQARDFFGPLSEYNCVYYLKDKYNLLDSGTFWLSETPYKKYSVDYDSACRRIASWAVLEDKETGKVYTHINTHLDHVLESTRDAQCKVLLAEMAKLQTQGTVVITGDFNTYSDGDVYASMTAGADDAAITADVAVGAGITYHNYGKKADEGQGAIDFIFLTKGTPVDTYKVIRDTVQGMYPSDHYPVIADIHI